MKRERETGAKLWALPWAPPAERRVYVEPHSSSSVKPEPPKSRSEQQDSSPPRYGINRPLLIDYTVCLLLFMKKPLSVKVAKLRLLIQKQRFNVFNVYISWTLKRQTTKLDIYQLKMVFFNVMPQFKQLPLLKAKAVVSFPPKPEVETGECSRLIGPLCAGTVVTQAVTQRRETLTTDTAAHRFLSVVFTLHCYKRWCGGK